MGPVRAGGGRCVTLGSGEGGGDMGVEEAGDAGGAGLLGVPVPEPGPTSG